MFADLPLLPELHQALAKLEYSTPTPIQAQTIPHLLDGRDLLGCAQTGTGKTAAFALPILNRLGSDNRRAVPNSPRALILAPTRELASQIGDSFLEYGQFLKLRTTCVFGGVGQGRQVQSMNRGVHILVATPGRLLDLMNQGHIRLDRLEVFVLDEADRMLDMGFLPDLKRIVSKLPTERHSLFFSATLPRAASDLAANLLNDPIRVEVAPQSTTVELIEQQVMFVSNGEKGPVLERLLQSPEVGKAIVFTRTKRGADRLASQLCANGVKADAIHGNKSQNARTRTLDMFRSSRLNVLVATDLAARGLDVDGLTHVVNYDLPVEAESYVHRIGRTGRAGASGMAVTLCDSTERGQLRAIERLIRQNLPVHPEYPDLNRGSGRSGEGKGGGGRNPFRPRGDARGRRPGGAPPARGPRSPRGRRMARQA
ncbi:DEAD/DEAH box helicase [Planctomicrobium piriforme]|uniref:DEAD/DEAH box helicase n=1 Tax=Planctomicrobium piriforme TaxID=1576369 RepID=UPI001FEBBD8A|nr:DEAD/DEAH box helicase [Planctomicrobium piriforme]